MVAVTADRAGVDRVALLLYGGRDDLACLVVVAGGGDRLTCHQLAAGGAIDLLLAVRRAGGGGDHGRGR